jgi:hypothetical protein
VPDIARLRVPENGSHVVTMAGSVSGLPVAAVNVVQRVVRSSAQGGEMSLPAPLSMLKRREAFVADATSCSR